MSTKSGQVQDTNYFGFGGYGDWGRSIAFDNSDFKNWTVSVWRQSYNVIMHPLTDPMGLQTLISDDAGASWKTYNTLIPGEDTLNRIGGTLQYIKGSPNLYYFTGSGSEGFRNS